MGSKVGRKAKYFRDPKTGLEVVGLTRRPDGRWRLFGTHKTFREDDPVKAIQHFHKLKGKRNLEGLGLSDEEIKWLTTPAAKIIGNNAVSGLMRGFVLVGNDLDEAERKMWRYVADQIAERPRWCAEISGIEWLAWNEHKKPIDLPSPKQIEDTWFQHAECKSNERRKVRDAWKDFVAVTGIPNPRDITDPLCIKFKDDVAKRGWAHRTCLRHFNRVRRIISFQIERGISREDFTKILALLRLMKLKRTRRIVKPNPISKEVFRKLLDAAVGVDRAMLLLMANTATYLEEVSRIHWADICGDVYTDQREKQGQCIRIAVLWPETLEALNDIPRRDGVEALFLGNHGGQITVSGAGKRFRKIREAAGLGAETTAAQIRDAAMQAMAEAQTNNDLSKLVMGHSCGISDHYALRKPKIVAGACEAIRRYFFETD